jgi:sulfur relay (sulfurtransferase) complex TusBCD TusD component (DsrE family)
MDSVTVVIQHPPYREGDKANALRFSGAALAEG